MSGQAQINISARVSEIVDKQQEYIEMMCMAYLKLTGIPPEEVVLVQDWRHDKIRWYFERKKGADIQAYVLRLIALSYREQLPLDLKPYEFAQLALEYLGEDLNRSMDIGEDEIREFIEFLRRER